MLMGEDVEPRRKFIEEKTPRSADNLDFVSINGFTRITLASFQTNERITIDHNLSFSYGDKTVKLDHLCIAEVKKERSASRTPIIDIMKNVHGLNTGLSKYCIGISYLHEDLKQNAFKPKKLLINKIKTLRLKGLLLLRAIFYNKIAASFKYTKYT